MAWWRARDITKLHHHVGLQSSAWILSIICGNTEVVGGWWITNLQGTQRKTSRSKRARVQTFFVRIKWTRLESSVRTACDPTEIRNAYKLAHRNCTPDLSAIPLTFWCRNYFFILAHPVYKMWIMHEQNTLELWNKLHFEEKKTEIIYHV
jgi:hypothetical protein